MAVPMSRAKGNLHSIQEIVDVYWLKGQLREEYSSPAFTPDIRHLHNSGFVLITQPLLLSSRSFPFFHRTLREQKSSFLLFCSLVSNFHSAFVPLPFFLTFSLSLLIFSYSFSKKRDSFATQNQILHLTIRIRR